MRFLLPDELPPDALAAIGHALQEDGEDPANWTVGYVWESSRITPPSYAVVMRWDEEVRAFTVGVDGEGKCEAWDVTR